jgi:hypothetical protein
LDWRRSYGLKNILIFSGQRSSPAGADDEIHFASAVFLEGLIDVGFPVRQKDPSGGARALWKFRDNLSPPLRFAFTLEQLPPCFSSFARRSLASPAVLIEQPPRSRPT